MCLLTIFEFYFYFHFSNTHQVFKCLNSIIILSSISSIAKLIFRLIWNQSYDWIISAFRFCTLDRFKWDVTLTWFSLMPLRSFDLSSYWISSLRYTISLTMYKHHPIKNDQFSVHYFTFVIKNFSVVSKEKKIVKNTIFWLCLSRHFFKNCWKSLCKTTKRNNFNKTFFDWSWIEFRQSLSFQTKKESKKRWICTFSKLIHHVRQKYNADKHAMSIYWRKQESHKRWK